jgi:uncharacterized membrane protein YeaQ/YmgE (transglycosylase-associated protein family)
MLTVLSWMLFGLIVGAIARLLVPGRDPMGWIATILLGIVGSLIGGGIAYALNMATEPYAPAGWILATAGAVIALLVYNMAAGARTRPQL